MSDHFGLLCINKLKSHIKLLDESLSNHLVGLNSPHLVTLILLLLELQVFLGFLRDLLKSLPKDEKLDSFTKKFHKMAEFPR